MISNVQVGKERTCDDVTTAKTLARERLWLMKPWFCSFSSPGRRLCLESRYFEPIEGPQLSFGSKLFSASLFWLSFDTELEAKTVFFKFPCSVFKAFPIFFRSRLIKNNIWLSDCVFKFISWFKKSFRFRFVLTSSRLVLIASAWTSAWCSRSPAPGSSSAGRMRGKSAWKWIGRQLVSIAKPVA